MRLGCTLFIPASITTPTCPMSSSSNWAYPAPDVCLAVGSGTHAQQTAEIQKQNRPTLRTNIFAMLAYFLLPAEFTIALALVIWTGGTSPRHK